MATDYVNPRVMKSKTLEKLVTQEGIDELRDFNDMFCVRSVEETVARRLKYDRLSYTLSDRYDIDYIYDIILEQDPTAELNYRTITVSAQ